MRGVPRTNRAPGRRAPWPGKGRRIGRRQWAALGTCNSARGLECRRKIGSVPRRHELYGIAREPPARAPKLQPTTRPIQEALTHAEAVQLATMAGYRFAACEDLAEKFACLLGVLGGRGGRVPPPVVRHTFVGWTTTKADPKSSRQSQENAPVYLTGLGEVRHVKNDLDG